LSSVDELWGLENLAEARRLGDFAFEQFAPFVHGDVVEVGAGLGTYSDRILAAGAASLLTVEPEPRCATALEEKFASEPRAHNVAELLPDAPALAERAGEIDYVLCQNVLEHIEDDYASAAAMAGTLRPGGVLSILVPAHPRLYGPLDKGFGHFRRYTRERLRAVMEATGLELIDLYSFNALGIAGWVVQNRRSKPQISATSLRAYEAMLRGWAPVERRVRLPVGLSLVAHGRRDPEG